MIHKPFGGCYHTATCQVYSGSLGFYEVDAAQCSPLDIEPQWKIHGDGRNGGCFRLRANRTSVPSKRSPNP